MAIVTRRFHYHEKGNHDETWHSLARDTDTGEVFVQKEWAHRENVGDCRIELAAFLASNDSTARTNLMKLIGSLVPDNG